MEYRFRSASVSKIASSINTDDVNQIINSPFNPLISDEGFSLLSNNSDKLFCFQYLREVPITYGEYNNGYCKRTEKVIRETNFQLDLENKMMIIFSGKKQSDFLLKRLSNIFGISFYVLEIDFQKLLNLLTNSKFIVRSEQAVINGFNYGDLMVGKYIANIKDKEILLSVIAKYGKKVEKIKLSLESYDGNTSSITIHKNGSFLFKNCRKDNIDIIIHFVHHIDSGDL
ncbi:hypothetical protein FTO70_10670 [Methanosarcina sp. KYL-1]|uniref:hypothetical protein n=1 Tax=Methanosarcina sp. KYL-1 TaxID=2602068 RepID=UPI0021016347|nr:hypothetical protein [Methanosarcina sp. KYL-1]MCQ1536134.1 hypothetical protein [Methanosarcina sp. KYL-1]